MGKKYVLVPLSKEDHTYDLFALDDHGDKKYESVFSGTLPECESWIRLHDKGYL